MIKQSYIKLHGNACAISAAHVLFPSLGEEHVFEVFKRNGYDPRSGTPHDGIIKSLDELGIKRGPLVRLYNRRAVTDSFGNFKFRNTAPTAAQFAREQAGRTFYVWSFDHAFIISNGVVIDPYFGVPRNRSRLCVAVEIMEPELEQAAPADQKEALKDRNGTYLRLLVHPIKNTRSVRRQDARWAMKRMQDVTGCFTVQSALDAGYTMHALKFEVERGHVEVVS